MAEVRSFTAMLEKQRPEEPLGVKADFAADNVVHISKLTSEADTPLTRYNASAVGPPVQPGDYILAVNNVSKKTLDPDQRLSDCIRDEILKCDGPMKVLVSRPYIFE